VDAGIPQAEAPAERPVRPLKGQDERQKTAPLTVLHATWELAARRNKNKEGRHVGLDFYDLLIAAHPVLLSDE
jgi:hypothetical protein